MNNRILELALETLETKKAEIEKEITQLQAELKDPAKTSRSQRMKKYWGRKKAELTATGKERKQMTTAQKKAISARMKAYWAKRRAEKTKGK